MRGTFLLVVFGALAGTACGRKQPAPAAKADAAPTAPPPAEAADAAPERPAQPPPGPYHVLGPLRDTTAFDACKSDDECVATPLQCCSCNESGLAVAVHRDKQEAWRTATCPEPMVCGQAISTDPTCQAFPRCITGRCRLTLTPPGASP